MIAHNDHHYSLVHVPTFEFALPPASVALKFTRALYARRWSSNNNFNHLFLLALVHSSALVWAVLFYVLFFSVRHRGIVHLHTPFTAIFASL